MGRKKRKVEKPWCWYCNREFDDDKILIQHQKAKHFKCHICHKKLFSGPGLVIHCMQVHKEAVERIPGAVMGRDSTEIDIYGMQGVPGGSLRGVEEPEDKRSRTELPPLPPGMPPMPPGPMPHSMPPFPPGFPPFMPPGYMPPMPPYPPRPPFPPPMPPGMPAMGRGFGAFTPQPVLTNPGPARGHIGPPDPNDGFENYGTHYPGQDYPDGDQEGHDKLSEQKNEPDVNPVVAAANKIASKTKIIHPDDYNTSLEERRMAMME